MTAAGGMTAADWSATAAWLTFGVAVAAAAFAGVQTLAAAADREARQRPHVVVDFDRFDEHHGSVRLVLANIGQTTARDVRLTFDPPLPDPVPGDPMADYVRRFTDRTWPYLPPGKVQDTMFAHLIGYPETADRAWTVTIDCADYKGRRQKPETTQLSLDEIGERVAPETLTMHDLATDVRKMREWLTRMPIDRHGVHVVSETEAELEQRKQRVRESGWLPRYRLRRQLDRASHPHQ